MGIIPKNEIQSSEMVDIMSVIHQYVPSIECTKEYLIPSTNEVVEVQQVSLFPILFGGDQLTVARSRGAKRAKVNSPSAINRFDGLVPVCEDWHTKVVLLEVCMHIQNECMFHFNYIIQVIWKYFYSMNSAEQHGTRYQLRNRLNRRNVVKNPKSDFNACHDFINLITSSHLVAATLETLNMKSVHDVPDDSVIEGANELWMKPHDERKKVLQDLCGMVVDNVIDFRFHKPKNTSKDKTFEYAQQLMMLLSRIFRSN